MVLIGVFAIAAFLGPDPSGFGTHRQLGLPACTIQKDFGVPCPSCGMTTSFAHFVRGQLLQSAKANLAGLVLAACCAAQIPWSLKVAISGRSRAVYSLLEILLTISVVVTLIAFIQWGVRLLF